MSSLFALLWFFAICPVTGQGAGDGAGSESFAEPLTVSVAREMPDVIALPPSGDERGEAAGFLFKVEGADPDDKAPRGYIEPRPPFELFSDEAGERASRWWKSSALRSQALVRVHAARGPPRA